jgi:hypothetical protein
MIQFESGATRDTDEAKLDYEGFLCPLVLQRYAEYMHKNRRQKDGVWRSSDNWQKGIPKESYMKSGLRHVVDAWLEHRGHTGREDIEEALCGVMFNAMGYLHELMIEKENGTNVPDLPKFLLQEVGNKENPRVVLEDQEHSGDL